MPQTATITVSITEALEIGALLKLQARKLQAAADLLGNSGSSSAHTVMAAAAAADSFSDKLYAPFLDDVSMTALNEQADKNAKAHYG